MVYAPLSPEDLDRIVYALETAPLHSPSEAGSPCDKHIAQGGWRADCPLCVAPAYTDEDEGDFTALAERLAALRE